MGKECLLQLQNVTKRYGDKIALNDFSMDICPGEIVALIGENGAGKTTLLNIICGYIKPSAGHLYDSLYHNEFDVLYGRDKVSITITLYCCSFLKYPTVHILHNDFFPLYYLYGNFIYPHWYS